MPKRSANNMGTVRKRPDGRWEGRYTGSDGKQHSVYAMTQKDCISALQTSLGEVNNGSWREPSKLTVAEWLDIWLKDYQTETSERTINKYRSIVKHFNKSIGTIKLTKLASIHVRRMVKDMENDGLKASSIDNYCRIFRTAMNRAVEARIIKENPADNVKLPKPTNRHFVIIDREEIPLFLNEIKKTPYENEYAVMLLTGIRIGEVRGLKWSDINFKAGTVYIQRQLQPKNKNLQRFTLPKYKEIRLLHVAPEVIDVLKDQRRKQAEQRLAAGDKWYEDDITTDLVFRKPNGKPHARGSLDRPLKKVGEAIDKPDLHPHDLRHSYAVAALRSGASIKSVQYNMGHKSSHMTVDIYARYTEDAGKTDALKLSNYLKENTPAID